MLFSDRYFPQLDLNLALLPQEEDGPAGEVARSQFARTVFGGCVACRRDNPEATCPFVLRMLLVAQGHIRIDPAGSLGGDQAGDA